MSDPVTPPADVLPLLRRAAEALRAGPRYLGQCQRPCAHSACAARTAWNTETAMIIAAVDQLVGSPPPEERSR